MFDAILTGGSSILARIGIAAALTIAIFGFGFVKGMGYEEYLQEKATARFADLNKPIVRRFHEKTKAIYRNAHNVPANLERLCSWKLRDTGRTAGAPEAEAAHGATIEGLAAEIPDCLVENAQLDSLIESLEPQVKRP